MFSWIDFKFAIRLLLKKPMFTATTVMIVALGLALTLFSWSLLTTLIFKPLTLGDDKPVYSIEHQFNYSHAFRSRVLAYDFDKLRQENRFFSELGAYYDQTALVGGVASQSATRKFNASYSEWNIFEFARVQPMLGRGFNPDDHNEGAEPVVVLGFDTWQTLFNGDEQVIGQSIKINAVSTKIIGVMPEGFAFPEIAEIWLPLEQEFVRPTQRERNSVYGYARLIPGVAIEQVNQYLDQMAAEIKAELPDDMWWLIREVTNNKYMRVVPFKQANSDVTHYYPVFVSMMIVVLLILLLACINIGNLLLSRVNERFKEIAVRVALGAPGKRLVMQMLWESICICLFGGVVALLLAIIGLDYANQAINNMFAVNQFKPFWWELQIDGSGLMVLVISVMMMITITGFIPAWRALHSDFNTVLRDGTRGAQGKRASRATKTLVISEILLSCVVLVMALILLSTSYFASNADYGIEVDNRLTAMIDLPPEVFPVEWDSDNQQQGIERRNDFYYQLKAHLESQNNIEAAIFMTQLPGRGEGTSYFEIEGRAAAVYSENPYANNEGVSRDSWHALGMKLIDGRDYIAADGTADDENVIINENIARDFFPDGNAVGSRIRRVRQENTGDWVTIVGVVSNTYHGSTMKTTSAQYNMYHLFDRWGVSRIYMAMHYQGSYAQAVRSLQQSINAINPDVSAYNIQSYQKLIEQPNLLVSYISKVFILCGVIAVILAASGIYAVAANSIVQKTQEIGVRRALGASDNQVIRLYLKQAGAQLATGLAVGLVISFLLIDVIKDSMLIDSMSMWLGYALVPSLIAVIVLLATLIPAMKAVKMEPAEALHQE